jgi:hypothetical protein
MLFWILESVTNKLVDRRSDALVTLAAAVQRLLEQHEPDLVPLFRTKKAELHRRPIRERIVEALEGAGITEPEPGSWVADAVRLRNRMSHGDAVDELLLQRTEVALRFTVWRLLTSYLLDQGFDTDTG